MLKFNGAWRFEVGPGPVVSGVVNDFFDLIGKIATQGDRQEILEHFKAYFASAAGTTASWSSSTSWAESDLQHYMAQAAENAPLFIEAFYDACETLKDKDVAVPDISLINRLLSEHSSGYEVQPPYLISRNAHAEPIIVPEKTGRQPTGSSLLS